VTAKEREDLIIEHIPYTKAIARKIFKKIWNNKVGYECDDVVSEGILGLIQAADRYDPSIGTKFKTFAYTRITGAIWDAFRRTDQLSRLQRTDANKIVEAKQKLMNKLGRDPTFSELSSFTKLNRDEMNWVHEYEHVPDMFTETTSNDQSVEDRTIEKIRVEEAVNAMRLLTTGEEVVVKCHYLDDMKLKDLSESLDYCQSRASQLRKSGLKKLQRILC